MKTRLAVAKILGSIRSLIEALTVLWVLFFGMCIAGSVGAHQWFLALAFFFAVPSTLLVIFLIERRLRKGTETKAEPFMEGFQGGSFKF